MSFDDLLSDLARTLRVPDSAADEAREAYRRACRRLDENPAEQQRINDIGDLLDAEEVLYAQARAAADRGETATAISLLRRCAEAGTDEAAWLLAQLLEETGDTAEAMIWYQHASDDGDDRADEKLADMWARRWYTTLAESPAEDRVAAVGQGTPKILISYTSELPATWAGRALRPADSGPADPVASTFSACRELLYWLRLRALHHGHASYDGLPMASIPPTMLLSGSGSGRITSLADTWRAPDGLAHAAAGPQAQEMHRLAAALHARDLASTGWTRWLVFLRVEFSKPQAAARTLRWQLDYEDYDLACPANLGRYLATAVRWHPRWAGREPVVADVMLPPSEVPECSPGTTVAQALELMVRSGTQALPVCEMTGITGIVTLADLAMRISDYQGARSAAGTVRELIRPAVIVPPDTPLPAIARAIADDGIIVVSGSGDRPDGYLTSESLLTQAPPGTSDRPANPGQSPLLIPGTGAVLLDHRLLTAEERSAPSSC